jgi:hypothetical protein
MTYIRYGAIAVALLAGIGIAAAQNSPMSPPSSSSPGMAPRGSESAPLQLSAQQKTQIFQTVTKEKVKTPPPANLQLSVGSQVPSSVELYPLPANILTQVPAASKYKYTVAQNQVVLVDPANMKIVEVIKQ